MATAAEDVNTLRDGSPPRSPATSPTQDSSAPVNSAHESVASDVPRTSTGSRRLARKSSLTKDFEERRRVRRDSRVRFREGEELTDSCPAKAPWKDGK